jgi:DNA repair photolyase
MTVIYEPKGKAREYAELACNLFTGCRHRCRYCYCPAIMRQSLEEWAADPAPRKDILEKLDREASRLAGCDKELLFSFMSDPYQSQAAADYTRQALLICETYEFHKVNVLTKNGGLAQQDFDILARHPGWKFGSTIIFDAESLREYWEPGASSIESRILAVQEAHRRGIYTWISVEPVVEPKAALRLIRRLKQFVNFWKIGKLNYRPDVEATINWARFLVDVEDELAGCKYYIKKDLIAAARQK